MQMQMVISQPRLKFAFVWTLICLFAAGLAVGAAPGGEREPAQRAGSWALGGDVGLQNTTGDDDLDTQPILGGYAEYYATNNLSWRGMIQFVDMDHSVPGPGGGDAEVLILGGNALYNWEGRQVSPFVTGGVGLYDYDTASGNGDDTELGLNLGGGLNLSVTPTVGVKFEGLVHVTSQDEGADSFVVGTGGVRFRL